VSATPRPGIARRRVLAGLLLVPPAVSACSLGAGASEKEPESLIALADAARADAALAAAAIDREPDLAEQVQPLLDARTAHAMALDAEVARLDPARANDAPTADAAPADRPATLSRVRDAVLASGTDAATVALDLPAEQVGLVASVAACCNTYAETWRRRGEERATMAPVPESGVSTVDAMAAEALQDALTTEHAAVWSYSLALAFLSPERLDQARSDAEAHRLLRGATERTLTEIGVRPVSAQPAYATPQPVVDGLSAAELVIVAETDTLAAWRSVLERTTDRPLRQAALNALTKGTLRCAGWRAAVDSTPAIPVFPGR